VFYEARAAVSFGGSPADALPFVRRGTPTSSITVRRLAPLLVIGGANRLYHFLAQVARCRLEIQRSARHGPEPTDHKAHAFAKMPLGVVHEEPSANNLHLHHECPIRPRSTHDVKTDAEAIQTAAKDSGRFELRLDE
jgi:hypothetical protein